MDRYIHDTHTRIQTHTHMNVGTRTWTPTHAHKHTHTRTRTCMCAVGLVRAPCVRIARAPIFAQTHARNRTQGADAGESEEEADDDDEYSGNRRVAKVSEQWAFWPAGLSLQRGHLSCAG